MLLTLRHSAVAVAVLYFAVIFIYLFILCWVFSLLLIVRLETLGFQSHEIQNFTPLFAIARREYAEISDLLWWSILPWRNSR